jgi:hypothetical protein
VRQMQETALQGELEVHGISCDRNWLMTIVRCEAQLLFDVDVVVSDIQ